MTTQNLLRKRCKTFIDELGIQVSKFADKCHIGRSTYYQWICGKIDLSDNMLHRIDNYLNQYAKNGNKF